MPQSYPNIPLYLLLNKQHFEQASELVISAFAIDLSFTHMYLSNLRKDLSLHLSYVKAEVRVLDFLKNTGIGTINLYKAPTQNFPSQKKILIHTPDSTITILTSSNLTKDGISDELSEHWYSDDYHDYSSQKRSFILWSYKNGRK